MTTPARRLDDNLEIRGPTVHCQRCGTRVGSREDWLREAPVVERPAQEGGSLIKATPELFVDAQIVYRQAFCPGCLTVLLTEVVAVDDANPPVKRLSAP